eukprot:RCo014100
MSRCNQSMQGSAMVSVAQSSFLEGSDIAVMGAVERPHPKFKPPIWSLFVGVLAASLMVVGAVVFVLTRLGGVTTIGSIWDSYRGLACEMMENEVVSFLDTMQSATKQLLDYAAQSTISPGNPSSADMRMKMFTILSTSPPGATSLVLGLNDGEVFALD